MTSYRDVSGAQDRDVREPGRNAGGCGGWWAASWGGGGGGGIQSLVTRKPHVA